MPDFNRISANLSEQDEKDFQEAIATIRRVLDFQVTLTAEERIEGLKLGDKTQAFDDKCAIYMDSRSQFLPGFISVAEVKKDRALREQLRPYFKDIDALQKLIEDIDIVLGGEIYMADLAYYQSVREAAKRGIEGAAPVYEDLATRFPGRPRKGDAGPGKE